MHELDCKKEISVRMAAALSLGHKLVYQSTVRYRQVTKEHCNTVARPVTKLYCNAPVVLL